MKLNGFKKFMEDMDPSPQKNQDAATGKTQDYFAQLGDEEGIQWDDLVKTLEGEPWISSHFNLGGLKHKLSAWEIVKGTMTPNGADIQLKPQIGDRTYLKGNRLDKSTYQDNNRYHLDRQQLIQFLTTGWTPAVQNAQNPLG
jgi:hypothetical protein